MLHKFPGRTLEELDQMDWFRLNRALEAGRIEHVEVRRRQLYGNAVDADDEPDENGFTPADWRIIDKSDKLLGVD